ncbi:MAG: D-glycerate dehydrogenase [Sphingomonas sp.]
MSPPEPPIERKRLRLLLTRQWPTPAIDRLRQRYAVTVDAADRPLARDALVEAMRAFDAICPTVTDRIDAGILSAGDARVRLLANYGAGTDHIDLAAARVAGIVVTNTPDVLTEATAEIAILLMLMAGRRAGEGERELRDGRWTGWRPTHLTGAGLSGKLLGLVGFGRIAQATARIARDGFGMRIAYHSRRRANLPAEFPGATYHDDLDSLLAVADVVSLHCPGGPETRHLIDRDRLAAMKPGALLINTARGSVVDEAALVDALRRGGIAGAGLDVFEHEPQVPQALRDLENAVLLPHLGSATIETRVAMGLRAAANVDAFFDGFPPPDRVA